MKRYLPLLIAALLFSAFSAKAQLFIDTSYTAEQMVMDFFDNTCVDVSNVIFNEDNDLSIAYFEGANAGLNVSAGILLSTGSILTAAGTNTSGGTSGTSAAGLTDPDLASIATAAINDAIILEFDIVPSEEELFFDYVFASEEYPEYVCSGFNDIFGFFVSGPGIAGPYTNNAENIALVPGTTEPVAINTINDQVNPTCPSYPAFYVDNTGGQFVTFDGYTTPLPAPFMVVPGETYHVKLVVADVGDSVFDSGVFIGVESLCGDSLFAPPTEAIVTIDNNTVSFENLSRYATSYDWDFGDGNGSTERYPAPHTYATDGNYTITLSASNFCCTEVFTTDVMIGIPTGVDQIGKNPFEVYPNPTVDILNIEFSNDEEYNVELLDFSGKVILSQTATSNTTLSLDQLSEGIYLLNINDGQNTFSERVLIKK